MNLRSTQKMNLPSKQKMNLRSTQEEDTQLIYLNKFNNVRECLGRGIQWINVKAH